MASDFEQYLFAVPKSSCIDWIGFNGARLFVRMKNWREQHWPYDHAYTYPCTHAQFNLLVSAPSVGTYFNQWFRFLFRAEHGTFRDLSFRFDTLEKFQDVESGLPKSVNAFQSLQYYSRILGNIQAFDGVVSVLAVVPESYPGAYQLTSGQHLNPDVVGLFVVPLACSTFVQNIQARIMSFTVLSMICSVVLVEGYAPVQGTLNDFGSCLLQLPGILEV